MAINKICLIILCILLSGCASYTEIYRDEIGRINKVKYSGNQMAKIDVKNDVVEVNNKADLKFFEVDVNALKGL